MDKHTRITYASDGGTIEFAWPPNSSYWFTDVSGLESTIELSTSQSAGQIGSTINSQSIGPKRVTFNGAFTGLKSGDVEIERKRLLSVVLPTKKARMTFKRAGEEWYIDGYPTNTPVVSDGETVQKFQFKFYAPYPYFYTPETKKYQLSGLEALWKTPFYTGGTFFISRYTGYDYKHVENIGDVDQPVRLSILASGQVVNPAVYNVDSGHYIAIKKTMSTNERFFISTYDEDKDDGTSVIYTSASGVESNGFKYITPDSDLSLSVPPGGATFTVTAEEYRENIRCILTTRGGERHSI